MSTIETTTLYHVCAIGSASLRPPKPAHFYECEREASAAHDALVATGSRVRVHAREFRGRIANEPEALAIWNETNPHDAEDAYLCSMLSHDADEFARDDIDRFVDALRMRGISGVRAWDYSVIDTDDDARCVVVVDHRALRYCRTRFARSGHAVTGVAA